MARNLLLTLILGMFSVAMIAQTSLGGTVTDEETGEPVLFGNVTIYKEGVFITGVQTDLDGNYNFANIDPGVYDVEASYVGLQTQRVAGVQVFAGKANKLDIQLGAGGINLEEVVVVDYKVPLIEQDNTTQGRTITSDDIKSLPTRNIAALAANAAGVSQADEGDGLFMKGSRSDGTYYYVDGIRVQGNLVPETEIDQLQVITGGIEAQYGDVTGGIISITTKGPSNEFSGSVDAETSEYLDPYRNSLVGLSLSGPILKNSEGQSILGFRLAGRYTYRYDDDPPAIPVYRVTDEKLKELEANPVLPFGNGGKVIAAEEVVGPNDVQALDARPYEDRKIANLTAKLDARLSEAVDVTLSGSYAQSINRFTPDRWAVYNSHNNPYDTQTDYRGNFRFRHRLGTQGASGSDGEQKISPIQNASYIIQVGFEKNFADRSDFQHGDNLFDYGYIGNWDYTWEPQITFDQNGGAQHTDFTRQFNNYTPGTVNPVLAAYNNSSDFDDVNDIEVRNGQVSSLYQRAFDFHQNVGFVYDLFRKQEDDIVTVNLTGNFDLLTSKSSNKGRHNVQFGIMYEQRTLRRYDVNPFDLWVLGDQLANRHILGVDTNKVVSQIGFPQGFGDTLFVDVYDKLIDTVTYQNSRFFRQIRNLTGQGLRDYVNVQGISPEDMTLSMFSAQELNDQNNLLYYGYDYLGNKLDPTVTFDDFFTSRNADGIRDFPVAAMRPIYASAYIQDKFTFKDIIFRLGLRVDRYDANTKVLKDPYSLYEIMGAGDFHGEFGGERPGNIGDDFKVYVTTDNGEEIKAYRDGDQWYRANGTPVNDGNQIFESGGLVFPKIKNVEARTNTNYIKSENFQQDAALKDYEVQVNWMPRLAFSFPISDEANFFAHYDILVQRPASNNIVTALDYFYFIENFENGRRNIPKNNANLLPERTVDYEVGFQQKLSNTSALKIAAYYKEMRNMIQRRTYLYVPNLITYDTYDNQDFGTVKGFTFTYDLRRTGNIQAQVAYTLQYADGTGSDPNSQRGLTQRGNLRTLFPLSFDERHRFNINLDYRYGKGKKYNGPVIAGTDILANTGLNVQAVAVSGRPYTQKLVPARFGGDGTVGAINGARLPWNFTINARLDKSFTLGGGDGRKGLDCNVYIRVSNLLNTQNWRNVYAASGTPYDDGFLQSSRGQQEINALVSSNRNLDNYLASYQWRMLNADYFSLPRRIFIGAQFGF
ncbi:MAG: carboxypeptidase regulatory-like domain-containing protein [Saprospiraceae bacterium]